MTDAERLFDKCRDKLWCDLTSDLERAEFLLCGRAWETGIIAKSIVPEVAAAFLFRHETRIAGAKDA